VNRAARDLQVQLNRLGQLQLQGIDLPLEASHVVVALLDACPFSPLHQLLDLQLDAQRVVGHPRIGHIEWCTRLGQQACCPSWI
jgi:hypothetical protein